MSSFFQDYSFQVIDARRGGYPIALLPKSAPKKRVPRRTWEECHALAKALNVTLNRDCVWFGTSSFENGKMYGFNNASRCHEALLELHRDRLSRMSNEELIKASANSRELLGA